MINPFKHVAAALSSDEVKEYDLINSGKKQVKIYMQGQVRPNLSHLAMSIRSAGLSINKLNEALKDELNSPKEIRELNFQITELSKSINQNKKVALFHIEKAQERHNRAGIPYECILAEMQTFADSMHSKLNINYKSLFK